MNLRRERDALLSRVANASKTTCRDLQGVRLADVFDPRRERYQPKIEKALRAVLAKTPDATLLDVLISADGVGDRTIALLYAVHRAQLANAAHEQQELHGEDNNRGDGEQVSPSSPVPSPSEGNAVQPPRGIPDTS